ncbi:hypothetical protein [Candidatus Uabimicrobium sp. HlEnr_7]|uniref:hypothetical protein n=1 Tax=Candidatus Uabimicrobium helgolandensis TaxID=3095367 RepID=UPI003556D052
MFNHVIVGDWTELSHSCGSAFDIPYQLQSLASDNSKEREKAISDLRDNIFCDGMYYEVSPYVIPELYKLLADKGVMDKHEIVTLLTALVLDFWQHHNLATGINFEKNDTIQHSNINNCQIYLKKRCYEAVEKEIPKLISLISIDNARLNSSIFYALSWFPKNKEQSLQVIKKFFNDMSDLDTIINAIFAIGMLSKSSKDLQSFKLEPLLSDSNRAIRVATAMTFARHSLNHTIIDILSEAVDFLGDINRGYSYLLWFWDEEVYINFLFELLKVNQDKEVIHLWYENLRLNDVFEYRNLPNFVKKQIYRVCKSLNPDQLYFSF